MKNLIFILFISSIFLTFKAQGQIASRILVTQSSPRDTFPDNYTFIDNTPGAMNRWWVAKWDSVKIKPINVRWINDTVISIGNARYARLAGSYTDPSFIQSLSSSKVFGLSPVALSGSYSDLSGTPNMANFYPISNPNGYISGITGSMITGALGYVPYDGSSNPNNYQTKTVQAANGLTKVSSPTADTIEADWNLIMSVQRATDSIASIKATINGKLNISDTTNKWLGIGYSPSNSQVISALGGTPLFSEVDGSTTNELQTLSIVNRIVTLSNAGGTVTIPYQSYDSLTNKPTTLSGFGITDGVTNSSLSSTLSGYATTSSLNSKMNYSDTTSLSNRINTKQNQLNGTGLVRMTGSTVSYDNSTYLTGITSGQITSALGYTPLRGSDTISLSNRINLKLNSSDTASLSTRINTKVDQAGARAALSAGTGISYNNTTGVISSTAVSPTFNPAPARSLNTNYTISSTQNSRISYTIALTTTLSLLNLNSASRVYLEYSTNGGTSWNTINSAGTSRTLSVAIAVGLNETTYWNLVGEVPANALVRLRSVVSGGGTATWDSGIEVTY